MCYIFATELVLRRPVESTHCMNVKVVQARLRHAWASTTLDTYSHLWPDPDDSTRTAVETVLVDSCGLSADSGGIV
jgi:hypothetical protein